VRTIVVHIPKRCRKPRLDVFDAHIDLVNSVRSNKYLPEDTNIIVMGIGGDNLIEYYKEKYLGKKKVSVDKSELKKAIQKQKKFLNGDVDKFW
tara:strand:- start:7700 stop:7978 length:279 start_codon:yes stop_codon:yes gene_type:complete